MKLKVGKSFGFMNGDFLLYICLRNVKGLLEGFH